MSFYANIEADVANLVENFGMDPDIAEWVQGDSACWPRGFVPSGLVRRETKWTRKADESYARKAREKKAQAKAVKAAVAVVDLPREVVTPPVNAKPIKPATDKQIAYLRSLVARVYPGVDMEAHTLKVIALGRERVSQAIDTLKMKEVR